MTRYELLDRIGVGGMAEIFRGKAVAAGGFEKPVAIKRILPHLSQDQRFVKLLIAEAKVLSLLKHRNIVQIFDVGLGDDQQYFLVMEYVDGKDLGAIQRVVIDDKNPRRKRMPFDLALHVVAEICEALEHAHSARAPDGKAMSLIHRDVSPSNILLSRAGEVKLTDFGIAKRAEQEQTQGGAVKGKFAYISPEQARNERLDARSDVFSVGILLWELVCQKRLFSGLNDMEALRGVRDPSKIPRPSQIDPSLSPELDALVMSALQPEPARRPTAGMFGAKIRSMRYSLEVTVGDPATELAKIIDSTEQVERQSQVMMAVGPSGPKSLPPNSGFEDIGEATVIRIHTADEFSMRDKDGAGMAQARAVIDRFEEEETRLAQLSGDQLRQLRSGVRDSGANDMPKAPPRPSAPSKGPPRRTRRDTDEPTSARMPIGLDDNFDDGNFDGNEASTFAASPNAVRDQIARDIPHRSLDSDEHTKLHAPRDRRTPLPERVPAKRAATVPPPRPKPPTPAPPQNPVPNAGAWNAMPPAGMTPGGSGSLAPPGPSTSGRMGAVPPPPGPPAHRPGPSYPQPAPSPGMAPMGGPPAGFGADVSSAGYGASGYNNGNNVPLNPSQFAPPQQPMGMPMQTPYPGQMQQQQPPWGVAPQIPQRAASPTQQDMFDRPQYGAPGPQQRPSMPQVAGFGKPKKQTLKPWMLVIGALIVAGLAFAVTRAFIGGTKTPPVPTVPAK